MKQRLGANRSGDDPKVDRRSMLYGLGAFVVAPLDLIAAPASLSGVWSMALHTEDVVGPLRYRFEIRADGSGLFTPIDQPVRRKTPLQLIATLRGTRINFKVPKVSISFSGQLVAPDRIEGEFDYPTEGGERDVVLIRGEVAKPAPPSAPFSVARLEALHQESDVAGIAVAVARRGEAPRQWITGERKRRTGVMIAPQDVFQFASCSKSFTATLAARLVDSSAMKWTDTLGDVLGKAVPEMLPAYRPVTLLHVLSHRAGFERDTPNRILNKIDFDESKAIANRLIVARYGLAQQPVGAIGGLEFSYSNTGYAIAAAMIEARTGRLFEDLIRADVYGALGLKSAVFRGVLKNPPKGRALAQPIGHPDQYNGGSASNPTGGVAMTLSDMLVYLSAHRDETAFLAKDSWRILHSDPFGERYALGWHVEDIEGGGRIHGGAFPGWLAKIVFNKEKGFIGAAVMNDRPRRGEALLTQCLYEALSGADRDQDQMSRDARPPS